MAGTSEGGKKAAEKTGHDKLSDAGRKGAESRSYGSQVEGGKKPAEKVGYEKLNESGRKGSENSQGGRGSSSNMDKDEGKETEAGENE